MPARGRCCVCTPRAGSSPTGAISPCAARIPEPGWANSTRFSSGRPDSARCSPSAPRTGASSALPTPTCSSRRPRTAVCRPRSGWARPGPGSAISRSWWPPFWKRPTPVWTIRPSTWNCCGSISGRSGRRRLVCFLRRQKEATGTSLPHARHLVVEVTATGPGGAPGDQIILHLPLGLSVTAPLALALQAVVGEDVPIFAGNDCLALTLPRTVDPGSLLGLVGVRNIEPLLRGRLEGSGSFGAAFREAAGRALLLPGRALAGVHRFGSTGCGPASFWPPWPATAISPWCWRPGGPAWTTSSTWPPCGRFWPRWRTAPWPCPWSGPGCKVPLPPISFSGTSTNTCT